MGHLIDQSQAQSEGSEVVEIHNVKIIRNNNNQPPTNIAVVELGK